MVHVKKFSNDLSITTILIILVLPLIFFSCEKDQGVRIDIPESSLVGEWLLSTSDNEKRTFFRIWDDPFLDFEVEIKRGKQEKGLIGLRKTFSNENGVISGRYVTQYTFEFFEFSWRVKDAKPLEISMEETGENGPVALSLYRFMGELELECSSKYKPDYTELTGVSEFTEFRIKDSTVAEIDSQTGELWIGENPGYTYILVTTPSGTCAIGLDTRRGNQAEYKGELWVCDLPTEQRWIRMILPSGKEGEVEVHRADYGKPFVMYESLTGNFNQERENISLTLTGETLSQPEKHNLKIMKRSDSEIVVNDIANDKDPMVFRRVLKTCVISPGERNCPNFKIIMGDIPIHGFKSHDETVASIDAGGEVTGIAEGITFVDVLTDKGTFMVEIDVDGGIIPYPFEEMFSTDETIYGNPLCHIDAYLGPLSIYSNNNSKKRYDDVRPILSRVDLNVWSGVPLYAVFLYFVDSITSDEVIQALSERYTLLESETSESCRTYINTMDLTETTVRIRIYLRQMYDSDYYVVYSKSN